MLTSVKGIYRNGGVELAELPSKAGENVPVIVTFLEKEDAEFAASGLARVQNAELRARSEPFAADWESSEMKASGDYDSASFIATYVAEHPDLAEEIERRTVILPDGRKIIRLEGLFQADLSVVPDDIDPVAEALTEMRRERAARFDADWPPLPEPQ